MAEEVIEMEAICDIYMTTVTLIIKKNCDFSTMTYRLFLRTQATHRAVTSAPTKTTHPNTTTPTSSVDSRYRFPCLDVFLEISRTRYFSSSSLILDFFLRNTLEISERKKLYKCIRFE